MLNKIKKAFEVFGDFKRHDIIMIVSPLSIYYYTTNFIHEEINTTNLGYDPVAGSRIIKPSTYKGGI